MTALSVTACLTAPLIGCDPDDAVVEELELEARLAEDAELDLLDEEGSSEIPDIPGDDAEGDAQSFAQDGPDDETQWWWWGPRPTNTNTCVADLGGIQACQELGPLGLPSDLGACCDGVRQLARDRCECNPAIDLLLGEEGQQIYDLEPLCRIVQPLKYATLLPRDLRSCSPYERHDYGCAANDMEMDAARLGTVLSFGALFDTATDTGQCFDTPSFITDLEQVFEPDAGLFVPYGIGTYSGYSDMAEYLGLAFSGLNHGYWKFSPILDGSAPSLLHVSEDGSTWTQGTTSAGEFLRGDLPYTDAYIEQEAYFEGCNTRMDDYEVVPTDALRDQVEIFTQTADLSKRWGVEDICRYHTTYCAPDPATSQFATEQECLDYMNSLPLYSEQCGPNRPLAGNSVTCKFKHHFMIPTNPALHCPHIGKIGSADPNNAFKCDDDYECADPDFGSDWPAVTEIGASTPQDRVDVFTTNNVGWESEPFGCAIPSGAGGHGGHGGHGG